MSLFIRPLQKVSLARSTFPCHFAILLSFLCSSFPLLLNLRSFLIIITLRVRLRLLPLMTFSITAESITEKRPWLEWPRTLWPKNVLVVTTKCFGCDIPMFWLWQQNLLFKATKSFGCHNQLFLVKQPNVVVKTRYLGCGDWFLVDQMLSCGDQTLLKFSWCNQKLWWSSLLQAPIKPFYPCAKSRSQEKIVHVTKSQLCYPNKISFSERNDSSIRKVNVLREVNSLRWFSNVSMSACIYAERLIS